MCEESTREERIKKYAYDWYIFRTELCKPPRLGSAEGDWEKAEHMVNAEDGVTLIGEISDTSTSDTDNKWSVV